MKPRKTFLLTSHCSVTMIVCVASHSGCALQSVDSDAFLVTFADLPSGEYAVRLRGEDNTSTSRSTASTFQRQASTQIKTSGISLTVSFHPSKRLCRRCIFLLLFSSSSPRLKAQILKHALCAWLKACSYSAFLSVLGPG